MSLLAFLGGALNELGNQFHDERTRQRQAEDAEGQRRDAGGCDVCRDEPDACGGAAARPDLRTDHAEHRTGRAAASRQQHERAGNERKRDDRDDEGRRHGSADLLCDGLRVEADGHARPHHRQRDRDGSEDAEVALHAGHAGRLVHGPSGAGGLLAAGRLPTTVVGLDAGESATCVVVETGRVRCWGANDFGGLGNGTSVDSGVPVGVVGATDVRAVAVGGGFACALIADGSIRCWGQGSTGQLGDGRTLDRSYSEPVAF